MVLFPLCLALTLAGAAPFPPDEGSIGGLVRNGSRAEAPAGSVDVLLRARRLDGDFEVVARTISDPQGHFLFEGLPIDQEVQYLPGATRGDIYYPGPRIQLDPGRPHARILLEVHDTIAGPNPLVIRRYDLVLQPKAGALHVTETMLIENPETASYIGRPSQPGGGPVTLQLGIPSGFERVTFHEEFFGRRFAMIGGRLATDIPWTPGKRELKFHYVVRNDGHSRPWERTLDLPCEHVRVTVQTTDPEGVSCSLAPPAGPQAGAATFESRGRGLPAGYPLRVEFAHSTTPFMAYARWVALAVLAAAIVGASVVLARHRTPRVRIVSPR